MELVGKLQGGQRPVRDRSDGTAPKPFGQEQLQCRVPRWNGRRLSVLFQSFLRLTVCSTPWNPASQSSVAVLSFAFTIVELLTVMAVIAILSAILLPVLAEYCEAVSKPRV